MKAYETLNLPLGAAVHDETGQQVGQITQSAQVLCTGVDGNRVYFNPPGRPDITRYVDAAVFQVAKTTSIGDMLITSALAARDGRDSTVNDRGLNPVQSVTAHFVSTRDPEAAATMADQWRAERTAKPQQQQQPAKPNQTAHRLHKLVIGKDE